MAPCIRFICLYWLAPSCFWSDAFNIQSKTYGRVRRCEYSSQQMEFAEQHMSNTTADSERVLIASNFWGSTVATDVADHLPANPNLDKDGPLPVGSYFSAGVSTAKERCRLGITADVPALWSSDSAWSAVEKLQDYLDAGLQTFSIRCANEEQQRWAEEEILGQFHRETPQFCRNQCHFTIPFQVPTSSDSNVRKMVLDSLLRTGAEAIDSLQVNGCSSPYVFDVLDELQELQREGFIHALEGRNIPKLTYQMAKSYGFAIDSLTFDANLLEMTPYLERPKNLPTTLSTPLAGGLLTSRYLNQQEMPRLWDLSWSERRYWNSLLLEWTKRTCGYMEDPTDNEIWHTYQTKLLRQLETISLKHGVSVASVVLRWQLQLDQIEGTSVTCRLAYPDDGMNRKDRTQELRQVFTFELDDDDVQQLWELAGAEDRSLEKLDELEMLNDDMVLGNSGLFLPGMS